MLAKSLKTTGLGGPGLRAVPFGDGRGGAGVGAVCWVGIGPLLRDLPRGWRCASDGLLVGLTSAKQLFEVSEGLNCGDNVAFTV